jgi:hypothetical protein
MQRASSVGSAVLQREDQTVDRQLEQPVWVVGYAGELDGREPGIAVGRKQLLSLAMLLSPTVDIAVGWAAGLGQRVSDWLDDTLD